MSNIISRSQNKLIPTPSDCEAMAQIGMTQYKYSIGILGDITPEHAKYLGYFDGKELYADMAAVPLEGFIEEILQGVRSVCQTF